MEAAAAMPLTVQRAGATLQALEEGEVKLRVRVMESERADRRQSVMQVRVQAQSGEAAKHLFLRPDPQLCIPASNPQLGPSSGNKLAVLCRERLAAARWKRHAC